MSLSSSDQSKSYLQKILQKLQGPNWLKVELQSNTSAITSTGTALDVNIASGTVIVSDAAEGVTGSAAPTKSIQIGGSDGTNLRTLKTDSSGNLQINILDSTDTVISPLKENGTLGTVNSVTSITNALPSGENHIGAIGGNSDKLSLSITTSSTAYTANDNIGGIQTLTNLLRTSGGTGILQGISFWALANQKPNLYIDFWDASPATGTYTNDAAQIIAGDHSSWLGQVEIGAADWKDTGVISRVSKTGLGIVLKGNASRNIYMTIQDKTGVTFGSTAGLFFKAGILQD